MFISLYFLTDLVMLLLCILPQTDSTFICRIISICTEVKVYKLYKTDEKWLNRWKMSNVSKSIRMYQILSEKVENKSCYKYNMRFSLQEKLHSWWYEIIRKTGGNQTSVPWSGRLCERPETLFCIIQKFQKFSTKSLFKIWLLYYKSHDFLRS